MMRFMVVWDNSIQNGSLKNLDKFCLILKKGYFRHGYEVAPLYFFHSDLLNK